MSLESIISFIFIYLVTEFATKTGDFASLSITDLRVLALALDVDKGFHNGAMDHLRREPLKALTQIGSRSIEVKTTAVDSKKAAQPSGWFTPRPKKSNKSVEAMIRDLEVSVKDAASISIGEDEEGWIKPAPKTQACDTPENDHVEKVETACVTTDFAMQNVLLQIGLNLMAVNGMRVKHLKNWVLRCHACFSITKDMSKRFCPKCGNATLIRTSSSINPETGVVTYYLKKNFQYNNRGTKYSLPTPKGGREGNLILREDQKEFQREVQREKREKEKAMKSLDLNHVFDVEYVPSFLAGRSGNTMNHRSGSHSQSGITIGHGRRNPNEVRRTK